MNKMQLRLLLLLLCILTGLFCTDWDLGDDLDEPPAQVVLEIVGLTDTSVTLKWGQSQDREFQSYKVYYGTSDIIDTTDKIADTIFFSHDTIKTVQPLEPEKQYFFRVVVTTYRNTLSASNIVDTITLKRFSDLKLTLDQPDSTAITESSVTLTWQQNWVEQVPRYLVYFDTTAIVDTADSIIAYVYDGLSTKVTGLSRSKEYWFRVFIERNGVPSAGSEVVKVLTASGVPKPVILDTIVDAAIGDTTVSLSWSKSLENDLLRYFVYFDTIAKVDTFTQIASIDTTDTTRLRFVDTSTVTSRILTLKRNKEYWFCVYSQDTSGFISASNSQRAKTKSGIPNPVTLSVELASDSSAMVRWTKNSDADFYRYVVVFNDTQDIDTLSSIVVGDPRIALSDTSQSDTSYTVMGLERDTKYWFCVYVQDRSGFIRASNIDSVQTDDGLPTASTLEKALVTERAITLRWTKNQETDFESYQIYYAKDTTVDSTSLNMIEIFDQDSTTKTIAGLDSITQYAFVVYVKNRSKARAASNICVNFCVILRIKEGSVSDTALKLWWTGSRFNGPQFKAYRVARSESEQINYEADRLEDYYNWRDSDHWDRDLDSTKTYNYKIYEFYLKKDGSEVVDSSNLVKYE